MKREPGLGRAEVSPGISTVLLILIALAGGIVVYHISQHLDAPVHEERVPPSAFLVEDAYFITTGNITSLVITVRGLLGESLLDTAYLYDREGVLHAVGRLVNPQTLGRGEVVKLVYTLDHAPREGAYRVKLGHGMGRNAAGGDVVTIPYKPSLEYRIYLVNIPNVPSNFISNPLLLKNALENIGNTQLVSSLAQLESVATSADEATVIINLHGEALPTPTPYWSGAGYLNTTFPNGTAKNWGDWDWNGNTPDWRAWLTEIRNAIASRGAVWIDTGGWAFYYLANTSATATWGSTTGTLGWYKVAQCDYGDCTMDGSGAGLGLHYVITGQEAYVTPSNTSAYCYSPTPLNMEATLDLQLIAPLVQQVIGTPPPLAHTTSPSLDRPCLFNATQVPPSSLIPLHKDPAGTGYVGAYLVKIGRGLLGHVGYGLSLTEEERAALTLSLVLRAISEKQ